MGRPIGSTIKLPYIQRFYDKNGKERFYFRRSNTRSTLPGLPGDPEFMDAYGKALTSSKSIDKSSRTVSGTFNHLIYEYFQSLEFKRLKQSTRTDYMRILEGFCKDHGHRLVKQMQRKHMSKILGNIHNTPGAAYKLQKRLKTLLRFAIDNGYIKVNPIATMKAIKLKEIHTWTDEEIKQFEDFWPIGTKQRLAFALHLFTGQRRSDIYRITWPDITNNAISFTQQKTGTSLSIPIHPNLQIILDNMKRKHISILDGVVMSWKPKAR